MKKAIFNVTALSALLVPALALAQNFNYVDSWVTEGITLLRLAITVITILMTVYFLVSVLRFIMNKDPSKSADFRKVMINGLIGLFVAAAVWGIIGLATNITQTGNAGTGQVTCPPGLYFQPNTGLCGNNAPGFN